MQGNLCWMSLRRGYGIHSMIFTKGMSSFITAHALCITDITVCTYLYSFRNISTQQPVQRQRQRGQLHIRLHSFAVEVAAAGGMKAVLFR